FRPAPRTAAGSLSPLAARPADVAAAPGGAGRRPDLRRPVRPPGGRHQPGRGVAVDSLARPGDPGAADRGQPLLPGLSLPAAPHPGATLAAGGLRLAALAAEQVAGGAASWAV